MRRHALLIICCIAVVLMGPMIGPIPSEHAFDFVIYELRIPRTLVAATVGATFGIVGAAFQCLFGNPLATPSTTGTTAGAVLGALVAFVLFPVTVANSNFGIAAFALAGALLIALPVAALASRRRHRMEDVLLAGIALTLAAGALTTGLQFQADMAATQRAVLWSLGSLQEVGYGGLVGLVPLCALCCVGVLTQTRALEALVAGEERAWSQGVAIQKTRAVVLGFGALGVAACVAWCGPIAFVGLIVPHIVRRTLGPIRRVLIPYSGLVGAAFLVGCDVLSKYAAGGRELPVGVMTATIGAPLLILLVLRRPQR